MMCHAVSSIGRQVLATQIGGSHRLLPSAGPIGKTRSAVGIGCAPSAVAIGRCHWQVEMAAFGDMASILDLVAAIKGRHRYNKLMKGR